MTTQTLSEQIENADDALRKAILEQRLEDARSIKRRRDILVRKLERTNKS